MNIYGERGTVCATLDEMPKAFRVAADREPATLWYLPGWVLQEAAYLSANTVSAMAVHSPPRL